MNGDCYTVAANYAMDNNVTLCHGRPVYRGLDDPDPDGRFGHAWCETDDDMVIDKSNGLDVMVPRGLYYAIGSIDQEDVIRYTAEQARERILTEKTWGPWEASMYEYQSKLEGA